MIQDINHYKGLTIIDHNGALAGYRSLLARFPDQHFAIIMLSNNASFDPQVPAIKIVDVFLKDQFLAETPVETPQAPSGDKEFTGDPELLATYTGKYELRPEFIINVTSEHEKLFVEAHEVPLTRLFQISPNEFTLPAMNARLTFAGDSKGEIDKIAILLNGQEMTARKMKTFDAGSVHPEDYEGDFFSSELGTVYTFVARNGQLIARQPRLDDFTLTGVNPDQFSTGMRFIKRITFTRDDKNAVTGCTFSGSRISNIKFKKIN